MGGWLCTWLHTVLVQPAPGSSPSRAHAVLRRAAPHPRSHAAEALQQHRSSTWVRSSGGIGVGVGVGSLGLGSR